VEIRRQEDVVVKLHYRILVLLGAWMAAGRPIYAGPPAALPPLSPVPTLSANQQLANVLAAQLRQAGRLQHYTVDVTVQGSTVELSGVVASQEQREEVLRVVQGVPGVERVLDHLQIRDTLLPVQAEAQPQPQPQGMEPAPLSIPPAPRTADGAPPAGAQEPAPIFQAPQPAFHDLNPPRMPPYAWPTYAPYNNFSRVACPQAYPYNSWPFIGPFYPFPKVPLGWRSVKLEWEDGKWWFSRVGNKYDWWRLRFW
jgi:hypothetical protein